MKQSSELQPSLPSKNCTGADACTKRSIIVDHCVVSYTEEESSVKLEYVPSERGRLNLDILIDGHHIDKSPFEVAVKLPLKQIGLDPRVADAGITPWGVAVTPSGGVAVTDRSQHKVVLYNREARHRLETLGKKNFLTRNKFLQPAGLCIDSEGNFVISELNSFSVKKCTRDGNILKTVGRFGCGNLQFKCPIDVGYNSHNSKFYVADLVNGEVQILNFNLSYYATIKKLHSPTGVAFDQAGNVYIIDNDMHSIFVFTPEGSFLRKFGGHGEKEGFLKAPFGICLDRNDVIYITEVDNNRVSLFRSDGAFLKYFGCSGGKEQLRKPHSIAVDACGFVYVCDTGNRRLLVF